MFRATGSAACCRGDPGTFERARRCWEQAREAFLETGAADDAEKFAASSTKPGRTQSVMIAATVSRNTRLESTISPVSAAIGGPLNADQGSGETGKLRPILGESLPPQQASKAHETGEAGRNLDKTVLVV